MMSLLLNIYLKRPDAAASQELRCWARLETSKLTEEKNILKGSILSFLAYFD